MTHQLTLGVIGHVDHGKTALVRALTGIETDRLKEEKERGLSIVLGFSYLEGACGTIDIIDVPGHEDFVRTMISGATGIDGALLVVAANEGVMPQTREHLEIADLLGIDRGLIVVTKRDLVSAEELELAIEEVRSVVAGTFLEQAGLVSTSAETKLGLDELRAALDALDPVDRSADVGHPFLPVDRVFVMRGFGPVVTGTLRGARLETNHKVELLPSGRFATIRGLQVHGGSVQEASPGQRVAVNLRNIKKEDMRRGDTLALQGALRPTRRLDAELRLLDSHTHSLRNGAAVRLLVGTTEVMAKVRLLDCRELEPGSRALVQLRLGREIATHKAERFIIRGYSPVRTIGGGGVIDAYPSRHKRFDAAVAGQLKTAAHGSSADKARMLLADAGLAGVMLKTFRDTLGLGADEVGEALAAVEPVAIGADKLIDAPAYSELTQTILSEIDRYHSENPHEQGIATARLRNSLAEELADDVLQHAVSGLATQHLIENDGGTLRLNGFDPLAGLTEKERRAAAEMERVFLDSGIEAPALDHVVGRDKSRQKLFKLLCGGGTLVILRTQDRKGSYVLHSDTLEGAIAKIKSHYPYPTKFSIAHLRKMLGATRKYTVPLVEHLDATGVTIRMGDLRQLRAHDGQ